MSHLKKLRNWPDVEKRISDALAELAAKQMPDMAQYAKTSDLSGMETRSHASETYELKSHSEETYATKANLATTNGNVTTLQVGLTAAQSNVSTLQSQMSTAQGNISTANGNIAILQSTLSALQATVAALPNLSMLTAALKLSLGGPETANNAVDAINDIDVAAGSVVDDSGARFLTIAAMTKRLDANWSVGNNGGGLDTGNKANSTWYHVFVIGKTDGSVDALFSKSMNPTMPSGWTLKRRVASIQTQSNGTIRPYVQFRDTFLWKTPVLSVNTTFGTTATMHVLTVPTGVKVRPLVGAGISGLSLLSNAFLSSPDCDNITPGGNANESTERTLAAAVNASPFIRGHLVTNTNGEIRARSSGIGTGIQLGTFGWIDERGRQ